jgi:hypothetical protein
MKNKMMLHALVVVTAAMFVVPAMASAGEPQLDSKLLNEGKALSFQIAGGASELRATGEPSIACTSISGTGKYNTKTTGELEFAYKGCTTSFFGFPVECHSTGQANNVITTGTSVFHNIYLTDAKTTPGILMTPPAGGIFTTKICAGLSSTAIGGNGIIGHLESPKCGGSSTTGTLNFQATGSSQTYKKVTATGTEYSLNATTSGGSAVAASEVEERTITFAESVTLTCV